MQSSFKNNSQLIQFLKKGNLKAYAYLVDTYNHKLCLYANSLLNDVSASKDIVQNVFMKVWEKRDYLKEDFSIKSYLYTSVYNGCINEYNRKKVVTVLEKKHIDYLNHIVEDKNEHSINNLIFLVKKAIQELPPRCKQIFLLSKEEGLSNIEISEFLNISINTVERQISIAYSKIRLNVNK